MENESFEIVQDSSYFRDNSFLSPPNEALRIQENEIQKLKKLNFNLKLRICQLEERLGLELTGNEEVNLTRRVSAYSDSEERDSPYPSRTSILKELEEEIYRRDLLLTKARTVILSLQKQLSHEDKRHMNDKINQSRQINDSTNNYEAELKKIREESIVPRLVVVSQRILEKLQPYEWESYEVDEFPSYANLSYVLNNLTLIEEKVKAFCEINSDIKDIPSSINSKLDISLRNSFSLKDETDKENIKGPYSGHQQSPLENVLQQSCNSSSLMEADSAKKHQFQTTWGEFLDSIRELGELTFGCDQLLGNTKEVTWPSPIPLKGASCDPDELQNCVYYVLTLQHHLRNIKMKLRTYSGRFQKESPMFQDQPMTVVQSLQNSYSALADKEIPFDLKLSEVSYPCPDKSSALTKTNINNPVSSEFFAQRNIEGKECVHNVLKSLTQFQQSVYFEKLQKMLAETVSLDAKIQQTQQKILKIQQNQSLQNCSSINILRSLSKRKEASFEDMNSDDSSSDNVNGLASVKKYQESFYNLASFVSGAFTIFEEMESDLQVVISEKAIVDTTELDRLLTWGQSVLAPSPFSPGSSRQQEYVLTVWGEEKTVQEGLNLLRNTAEIIKQNLDLEKKQDNDQSLKDTMKLAKSLTVSYNFVERLAHTIATKQNLLNQRLGNMERRLEDLKSTAPPKSRHGKGTDLLLAVTKMSPMPKSQSHRGSSHKALKKWVLEQISETQRTIQQTQKSLDHERKYLLFSWLSSSSK
ncbi:hypothetical protein Gasu2_20670 [Galdieria sulphuraria]|uniref:Centrosomin N-terminal motif 1 domain-containing protein n=1 Tax=Galdieria sulphuraria TaxID=130081 RepID=M2Y5Q5_GALSU|nr:uncharacterized protein Gasu_15320 [Galdieria sulphuraria]EME31293.1 hypothetical protein Gasu_15320 [Galdieria sulphuraria]GJD07723.1 hypothetical protein Gasu2_20670 [Galdieria sulphuraria]|eukprot:XP_005707813.1 hypothetical protein Gasu_15320 [Galdieria sulphuraria]